ncbi:hypothetical protein E2C01_063422 [Portunus trituberculatus]|uniref:Uncharacterized protein n=1 Tax=Portunus trituberculatus TaxID=210409 RepID=A0A5B7HH01_PORTR|nr:hypothetical protein [Portunus trituberculatus]
MAASSLVSLAHHCTFHPARERVQ